MFDPRVCFELIADSYFTFLLNFINSRPAWLRMDHASGVSIELSFVSSPAANVGWTFMSVVWPDIVVEVNVAEEHSQFKDTLS